MAHARTDLPQYPHACETLKNMIPSAAGGGHRRPGTIYQDAILFSAYDAPVFFPFVSAGGDEYKIACFARRDAGPNGIIYAYSSQQETLLETFAPSTRYPVTPIDRAGAPANFMWEREDLLVAKYVQEGDVLTLTTPKYQPMRIYLNTAFPFVTMFAQMHFDSIFGTTLGGTDIRDAWPYQAQNTGPATFTASALTGAITVTMSHLVFNTADVGSVIKIDNGGVRGCVRITSAPTPSGPSILAIAQTFNADVIVNLGAAGPTPTWWQSAWSDFKGWPGTVELYRSRKGYGGNTILPDSIWFTQNSDSFQLSAENVLDPDSSAIGSEPFTLTLVAGQRSRIKWMKAAKSLLVGTDQSEWLIDKDDTASLFGGDNKSAIRQSEYGSNGVIAYTGNEIFFVSADGSVLRSLAFSFYDQAYIADEVHNLYLDFPYAAPSGFSLVTQSNREIIQVAWDQSDQTLWCIDNSGHWRGLMRVKKSNINAWHAHELGGYDASVVPDIADVDATFPSAQLVCEGSVITLSILGDKITKRNNLWLGVRRKINGNFVWTVETMRGDHVSSATVHEQILATQCIFTDCSLVRIVAGSVATYAVAHLEGKSVRATANNVTNGMFTLPAGTVAAGVVSDAQMKWTNLPNYPGPFSDKYWLAFGFNFQSLVRPVRPEAGSVIGGAQGAMKRITKVFVRFFKTLSAKIGADDQRLEDAVFRTGTTPMSDSAELFTGDKEILLNNDFDRDGYMQVQQDEPLPFSVVGIVAEGATYD